MDLNKCKEQANASKWYPGTSREIGGIVIGCDNCHEPLEATALPFESTTVLIYLHTRDITLLLLTTYQLSCK